jgi:hypothetical protein
MIGSPMLVRQLVWSEKDFMYICYQPCWEGYLCAARPGGFCKELKQHITMNVSVPLAISLAAVLKFTADKKLSGETLAYPILCELLDLVQKKVAEDLVFLWDEMLQNWMAFPSVSYDGCTIST